MYNGQRVSRHVQNLESMAMVNTGFDGDQFDEYGVPLKSQQKSSGGGNKKGFINRFKRTGNKSAMANDDDSDDDGAFEVVPGANSSMNSAGSFQIMNNAPQPQPQHQMSPVNPPNARFSDPYGGAHQQMPMHNQQNFQNAPQNAQSRPASGSPNNGEIGMDQLSSIRDRHRYPSMKDDPHGNRAMSLNSMSNYDTTPIIPMLGPLTGFQSGSSHNKTQTNQDKYRQRMIDSRRALLSTESGIPMSGNPMNPQGPPPGGTPPAQMPMELPYSGSVSTKSRAASITSNTSATSLPRNRSNTMNSQTGPQFTGPNTYNHPQANPHWRPQMGQGGMQHYPSMGGPMGAPMMAPMGGPMGGPMGPNVPYNNMNPSIPMPPPMNPQMMGQPMGYNQKGGPRFGPGSSSSLGGPRSMSNHSPLNQAYNSQAGSSKSLADEGGDFDFGADDGIPGVSPDHTAVSISDNKEIKSLEDEVRVLSLELGESTRRELKLEPRSTSADSSQDLADAYRKLSLERAKRQSIEEAAKGNGVDTDLHEQLAEIKFSHSEAAHLLSIRTEQYEALQTRYNVLEVDYRAKQANVDVLDKKLKEKSVSDEMYAQDENLRKELATLQEQNAKLRSELDEVSDRGPLGDRVKALEDQRSALQEALRAMRERKDAEIKALNTRIETLTSVIGKRSISSSSQHNNANNTPGSSRNNLHINIPRRVTSSSEVADDDDDDSQLSLPKRSRDFSIGRPSSPLNLGLEYSRS